MTTQYSVKTMLIFITPTITCYCAPLYLFDYICNCHSYVWPFEHCTRRVIHLFWLIIGPYHIVISKIFEKVNRDQLYENFEKYNLLAEQQYGFRKQHSTEYAAVKLIDHVSKEIENGKSLTNVYLDLSKAFDTLTFDVLLFKLKYYEVTDTALNLMQSYLTNRKQYVVFNSCQSDYSEIY